MAAPRNGAVHPGPAHLLQRGLLLDHHLDHARAAQVHRRVAVHHGYVVAERGDVGAAGRRGPEQRAHLRDRARGAHLGVEDLPGPAAAGEHLDLVGDPRPGGVDQVDHGQPGAVGLLDDPDDLLDGAGAPGTGLDRRVVGHQRHRPAVDAGRPGDHAVGGQPVGQYVGVPPVLGEAALVGEQPDPLPGEELACLRGRLVVLRGPAPFDAGAHRSQISVLSHEGTVPRPRARSGPWSRSRAASSQPGSAPGLSIHQVAPASW